MKTIDPPSAVSYLRVAFADAERDLVETAIGRTCWACSKSFDDYLVTISIRRLQPIRGIELELPLDGKQDSLGRAIDKLNDALYMSDIGGKFVGPTNETILSSLQREGSLDRRIPFKRCKYVLYPLWVYLRRGIVHYPYEQSRGEGRFVRK